MPAKGNIAALKRQVANKVAAMRTMIDEAGQEFQDGVITTSRDLDAAYTALDAMQAHVFHHLDRQWAPQG